MNWTATVRERLAQLQAGPPDEVLVEELSTHLAQACEDARARGLSDDEATAHALRVLEASDLLRHTMAARRPAAARRVLEWTARGPEPLERSSWASGWNLWRDARYGLRMLVRAPAFSLVAVLTCAVGIGINTAVFNVVNGVLLRPLPYPDAGRITMLWMDNRPQDIKEDITSYPNFVDWRAQGRSYAYMAGFTSQAFTLTGDGEPERMSGASVTAEFFDVMQVRPIAGRTFTVENETSGRDAVAVISQGLWQRRFGGAQDAIGKSITLNGRAHEIIGIMPADLSWPQDAELWRPLAPSQQQRDSRGSFWLPVIGRMKPGVTAEQAQAEMSQIGARLAEAYPSNRGFGVYVVPLHQQIVGHIERVLLVLLAAVGFVLLIGCANLSNLMLGRTTARRKELAIRTALGAGRGRLVRQIVTETMVLALFGGALGCVLAYWGTTALMALGGDSIPRPDAIRMDARVLGFALALSMLSALLSGCVPALLATRQQVSGRLREGAREGVGGSRRTRSILVAVEMALALILLSGAGLLTRTLWTMQQAPRGFNSARVATMRVSPPGPSYPGQVEVRSLYARLLDRVRVLPGVEAAASGTGVLQPLLTNSGIYSIEGQPQPPPERRIEYPTESVSPGYFETVGMTLVQGRGFREGDHADATPVVVINETFAKGAWPGRDPIGRRIRPGDDSSQLPWWTVVGVIRDAHRSDLMRAIRPEVYVCSLQRTARTQTLFVRTAGDPEAVVAAIRGELRTLDPQLPLFGVSTLERELSRTLTQPRFQAVLLSSFAVVALLLAGIGIYGVTSHAVGQRTQEIGIRMAMGAARGDVLRMILLQQLRPALAGIAAGLVGALALTRALRALLYGVSATDPVTFVAVAGVLLMLAVAACLVPARRATRVNPIVALRGE